MASWLNNLWAGKTKEQEEGEFQNQSGTITFADMKEEHMKTVKLINTTPETMHRVVRGGLNLEGQCRYQPCKVFEKRVWSWLGYGEKNINKEIYRAKCPICKVKLPSETVLTVGYTMAFVRADGKLEDEKEPKQWDLPAQTQGKFVKFEGYDGATAKWNYLTLTATEVKPN